MLPNIGPTTLGHSKSLQELMTMLDRNPMKPRPLLHYIPD